MYFSKKNIQYMDNCGNDFVIMVKGMNLFVSVLLATVEKAVEYTKKS